MATGDIYAVLMKQVYFTVDILNVWFYRQSFDASPALSDAEGLFDAFDTDILANWDGMVNASISIPELEVFRIADPSDNFIGTPTNNVGTRPATDNLRAPSWVAAGFKSNRVGTGTRSSFKRFAGLMESDIDDNVISPTFIAIAAVQALKTAMSVFVSATGGSTYLPIQVKSGWILGLPPTENFVISNWLDPKLTSQVSRKP